jgi:hypothetical protein
VPPVRPSLAVTAKVEVLQSDREGSSGLTAQGGDLTASLYSTSDRTAGGHGRAETLGGVSDAGMGATLQDLCCRKMSKLLVKRGEIAKGQSVSSKTANQETMMLLVERSRHR